METTTNKKDLNFWLTSYARDHQDPKNQLLHKICVPVIFLCTFGVLYEIPNPFHNAFLGWDLLLLLVGVLFYARLSLKVSLGMLVVTSLIHLALVQLAPYNLLWVYVAGFVVGWIGQAIGHKYEGAKPSFFTDLGYLFIGPLWIFKSKKY